MNPDSFLPIRINGKIIRLHPFGNNHHVEIVRDKKTGKYKGVFVNTWQAAQRIRNEKMPLVQSDHGPDTDFVMALHINDMVSVHRDGRTLTYRVQKLDPSNNRLMLRSHTAATLDNVGEELVGSIQRLSADYQMKPLKLNVLGFGLMIKQVIEVSHPSRISAKDRQLVIEQTERVVRTPIEDLGVLLLAHPQITVTQFALAQCQGYGIVVVVCNESYLPTGFLLPLLGGSLHAETLRIQVAASKAVTGEVWRQIIKAKIASQAQLLAVAGKAVQPSRTFGRQGNAGR